MQPDLSLYKRNGSETLHNNSTTTCDLVVGDTTGQAKDYAQQKVNIKINDYDNDSKSKSDNSVHQNTEKSDTSSEHTVNTTNIVINTSVKSNNNSEQKVNNFAHRGSSDTFVNKVISRYENKVIDSNNQYPTKTTSDSNDVTAFNNNKRIVNQGDTTVLKSSNSNNDTEKCDPATDTNRNTYIFHFCDL